MILEKKKYNKTQKKKMLKAQIKGKKEKKKRVELKKQLNKEKKRKKKKERIKEEKRKREKERRKSKKIIFNKEKDEKILNAILETIWENDNIKKHFDFTYSGQIYEAHIMVREIILHIKYALPWRVICSSYNLSHSAVHKAYIKLLKFNIIMKTYEKLITQYILDNPDELIIQSSDVTVINNKYGSELVEYNGHKKKKCNKASIISTRKGKALSLALDRGSKHDSKILFSQLDNELFINTSLNDKYKKYILCDSAYDCKELIDKLISLGYTPIIVNNKRNNNNKIMSDEYKEIYKERVYIEHYNGKIKTNRRVNCRYDRSLESLTGSFHLSFIDNIINDV